MNGEQLHHLSRAVLSVKSAHCVLLNAAGCWYFFSILGSCAASEFTQWERDMGLAFWLGSKKSGLFQECWTVEKSGPQLFRKSDPINPVITPFSGLWLTHGLIFTCRKCWQELGVPIASCCLLLPKEHGLRRRWSRRFTGARFVGQNGL